MAESKWERGFSQAGMNSSDVDYIGEMRAAAKKLERLETWARQQLTCAGDTTGFRDDFLKELLEKING